MIEFVKALILPSHLTANLLFLGLFLACFPRLRRIGMYSALAGALVYLVFSNGIIAASLIGPLEYRFPPVLDQSTSAEPRTVVVLTSFATDDHTMPLSSRAGSSALYRVVEASHLYRRATFQISWFRETQSLQT